MHGGDAKQIGSGVTGRGEGVTFVADEEFDRIELLPKRREGTGPKVRAGAVKFSISTVNAAAPDTGRSGGRNKGFTRC